MSGFIPTCMYRVIFLVENELKSVGKQKSQVITNIYYNNLSVFNILNLHHYCLWFRVRRARSAPEISLLVQRRRELEQLQRPELRTVIPGRACWDF